MRLRGAAHLGAGGRLGAGGSQGRLVPGASVGFVEGSAGVVELGYTAVLRTAARKGLGVRIPPPVLAARVWGASRHASGTARAPYMRPRSCADGRAPRLGRVAAA